MEIGVVYVCVAKNTIHITTFKDLYYGNIGLQKGALNEAQGRIG